MEFQASDLVNHPFSFAIGVGIANGLLAKARDKSIDPLTATTLAAVLGLGETALVMYEPKEVRGKFMSKMSLMEVGLWSCGGLLVGLLPFVTLKPAHHGAALPVAEKERESASAAAGFGRVSGGVRPRNRFGQFAPAR